MFSVEILTQGRLVMTLESIALLVFVVGYLCLVKSQLLRPLIGKLLAWIMAIAVVITPLVQIWMYREIVFGSSYGHKMDDDFLYLVVIAQTLAVVIACIPTVYEQEKGKERKEPK